MISASESFKIEACRYVDGRRILTRETIRAASVAEASMKFDSQNMTTAFAWVATSKLDEMEIK